MRVAALIARILLGVLFTLAALMGFFMGPPPPQPGLAGVLSDALYHSHWSFFVATAQLVAGVLLLVNRYVPVALIVLAAFLYNSIAFHLGTSPVMLPVPIVALVLVVIAAWPYRAQFGRLFTARPEA